MSFMEMYHNLSLVCTGGVIVFSIISAVCFVKFEIRTACRVLVYGAGRQKTICRQKTDFYVEKEIMLIHTDQAVWEERG